MMKTVYRNVVRNLLCAALILSTGALAYGQSIYPAGLSGLSNLAQIWSEPGGIVIAERKPVTHFIPCMKDDSALG